MTSTNQSTSTISSADMRDSLAIVEIKPGLRFSRMVLKQILPDVESTLFFGKVYNLTVDQLALVLSITVGNSSVLNALVSEADAHSSQLQDYVLDLGDPDVGTAISKGEVNFDPRPPHGEILPSMWEMLEVQVAASIQEVANKLSKVLDRMPGKAGEMAFASLAKINARRPTIGDYRAQVTHAPHKPNLVIFDVSGSVSHATAETIVDDVVALSYKADAHLAIVSDTCTWWDPGSFSTRDVMEAAEFNGTRYEQLGLLLEQDWGTVVTIADYDSAYDARTFLASKTGHIDEVLDVSIVDRPTFLAECVGQRAASVRPLLTATHKLTRW